MAAIRVSMLHQMTALLIVLVVVGVAPGVCIGARWLRRMRRPPGLDKDWWPAFEREFRAYARGAAQGGDGQHGRREGGRRSAGQ